MYIEFKNLLMLAVVFSIIGINILTQFFLPLYSILVENIHLAP